MGSVNGSAFPLPSSPRLGASLEGRLRPCPAPDHPLAGWLTVKTCSLGHANHCHENRDPRRDGWVAPPLW